MTKSDAQIVLEAWKPSPYVLRQYAKDMDTNTRLIDGDIAPYLRKVADYIEHTAAQRLVEGEKWLPIETAPKDRKSIIGWPHTDGGDVGLIFWVETKEAHGQWRSEYDREYPTHWMPLPTPPTTREE